MRFTIICDWIESTVAARESCRGSIWVSGEVYLANGELSRPMQMYRNPPNGRRDEIRHSNWGVDSVSRGHKVVDLAEQMSVIMGGRIERAKDRARRNFEDERRQSVAGGLARGSGRIVAK